MSLSHCLTAITSTTSVFATCAITQNGFVRIIGQPRYPSPVTPTQAISTLARAAATEHHEYWPCSVSLLDDELIDHSRLPGHRQTTDAICLRSQPLTAAGSQLLTSRFPWTPSATPARIT